MDDTLMKNAANRAGFARRALLHGAALGSAAALTGIGARPALAAGGSEPFPSHPRWKFVFVNHVTTNPFFTPTQYGVQDACGLLGCDFQWTGSANSDAAEMVNAMNTAVAAKVGAIAVSIVDPKAFNAPTQRALDAGIPVFSYNADAPPDSGNGRLAYIGQDLYQAGVLMGQRIVSLVDSGTVALIACTPPTISTQGIAEAMRKYDLAKKGVHGGGFDLLPRTLTLIQQGHLDFTIDQQPYLQGFYTAMEMFTFLASGGLVGPGNINTGLKFVTKDNVAPYLSTETRYEGKSERAQILPIHGAIKA